MSMNSFVWVQILKLLRRPTYILMNVRGRSLFLLTWLLRKMGFLRKGQIHLGDNVRLQKISGLMAEYPKASISIGDNCIIYEDSKIAAYDQGKISIGANSVLGEVKIIAKNSITIGSHFITSWNVYIQDYDSHPTNADLRRQQLDFIVSSFQPRFSRNEKLGDPRELLKNLSQWSSPSAPISIGDNVWIGANSTVLKGANIGSNSIVAAHSVVLAGQYPDNSLLVGVPAKAIPISKN